MAARMHLVVLFTLLGVTHGSVDNSTCAHCLSTADESSLLQSAVSRYMHSMFLTADTRSFEDRKPSHVNNHPETTNSRQKDYVAEPSWLAKHADFRRSFIWLALSTDEKSEALRSSTKASGSFYLVSFVLIALLGVSLLIYAMQPGLHEKHDISLWTKVMALEEKGQDPEMFNHLELAKDGGFGVVKNLYSWKRCPSAMMLVLFLVYNVVSVAYQDFEFVMDPLGAVRRLSGSHGAEEASQIELGKDVLDGFYFSQILVKKIMGEFGKDFWLQPVQLLGILELVFLAWYLSSLFRCFYGALRYEGFSKWSSVEKLSWEVIPSLSTFSAMTLLGAMHPAVVRREVLDMVEDLQETIAEKDDIDPTTGQKKGVLPVAQAIWNLLVWPLKVGFLSFVGFDTFLMKLRVVSALSNHPNVSFDVVVACLQFFIQVVAVIQLNNFVRSRLFIFIFGGEDSVLQEEERVLLDVYNALLARRMYMDICVSDGGGGEGSVIRYLAVVLSYSDEDFQSLVLNERREKVGGLARNMLQSSSDSK